MILTDPPSTYVEAIEFTTIRPGTPYSTLILPNGEPRQNDNSGFLVKIDYPPAGASPDLIPLAESNMKAIREAVAKYPQYKLKLQAALTKWQTSLEVYKQMAKSAPPSTLEPAKLATLLVDGAKFENVTLTSVAGEAVGISHESGVTKIPIAKLTKDQILALNKTSAAVRVDPDWAAKRAAAEKHLVDEKTAQAAAERKLMEEREAKEDEAKEEATARAVPKKATADTQSANEASVNGETPSQVSASMLKKEKTVSGEHKSVDEVRKAAEQGDAQAQNMLGGYYLSGSGVKKDYYEGLLWLHKAAEQGLPVAQYNLGLCYDSVEDPKYAEEAATWYRKAAEQGFPKAQKSLAICYRDGKGVDKDPIEAEKWSRKAKLSNAADSDAENGVHSPQSSPRDEGESQETRTEKLTKEQEPAGSQSTDDSHPTKARNGISVQVAASIGMEARTSADTFVYANQGVAAVRAEHGLSTRTWSFAEAYAAEFTAIAKIASVVRQADCIL